MESRALWDALALFRVRVLDAMQADIGKLGLDMSLPQSLALTQVALHGPLTVSELQARVHRSQATTSHLITQLELKGLVQRVDDPEDARRTRVSLSPAGERLLGKLEDVRRKGFDRVLGKLPASVRKQLEDALLATLDALEKSS